MTDIETAIIIKNMAREMVKRRTTAKNAPLSDMWNKENDLFRKGDDVVFRGKGRGLIQGRIKDIQGNTYIISSGEGEYRLTKEDLKGSSKH
ncbi:MAG: hypothetical protein M0R00_05510 [Candidatus Omnitrophica bacterium]|jgi:hypothetical protein|nr:hypothetical protein [Candidatus Omnitrophota bacterium]